MTNNFLNINVIENALGFIFNQKRLIVYENNNEVLSGISVLNYSVNNDSQIMEHPIESGAVIADHHVFNPIQISCNVAMPPKGLKLTQVSLVDVLYGRAQTFEETYTELSRLYNNSVRLRIKTDAQVYNNMYITSIPSDVSSQNADRQIFQITFQQAITVIPQYIKISANQTKNPGNAGYVKTGEILPATQDTSNNNSILYSILYSLFGG